jgi:Carboxypeptidase regulatory-like domain/TonB-dependent Receptor Plug Domain
MSNRTLTGVGYAAFGILFLVLLMPASARAQSQATTGTIEGIVTDSTGAVLPGVSIILTNAATGFKRELATDESGRYRGLALPLGTYKIEAKLAGFDGVVRDEVPLAVGQAVRIDFRMSPAGVTEQVNVAAGSPVVETTSSTQGALVDEKSVANLPINGRNFLDFVKLGPTVGVVQGPDGAELSINGQRGIYNNVMIDGADANNPFFGEQRGGQRPKYIISLEAVKEFQVVTDGASAEFGRSAGGFVNMVTKSGTNRTTGTGFYFGRYDSLLSENSDGTKDTDFSQHQFGGSLGGPLQKDRAFYFVSWDQNEEKRTKSKAAFDDPAINPNGEGRRLLNLLASRFGLTNEGGAENPMPQTNDARVFLGKLDANIASGHQASVRYAYSWSEQLNGTFDVPTWTNSANGIEQDRSHSIAAELNSTFGAKVNEARVQYAREPRPRPYTGPDLPDTAIANFPAPSFADRSFRFGRPFFLPVNDATDQRFQAADSLSLVRGPHLVKFGGEVNWTTMNQVFQGFARGRYIFTGGMPQFEAFLSDPTSAAALSSFVLYLQRVPLGGRSIEDSGRQSIPVWEPAFFVQDKWSLRSHLTLNAGLRWEGHKSPPMLTPPSETPYARYYTDPRFPTDDGKIPNDWSGFQPRLGISWDPTGTGRTAVRGTAGLFKARTPGLVWANPRTANGVIFATYTGVIVPGSNFGVPTFPNLVPTSGFANTNPGISVVDKDFKNPQSLQLNASVEHEIIPQFAIGAAFNYAKTKYLSRFTDPNVDFSFTLNAEGRRIYAGTGSPNRPFPTLGQVLTTESTGRSDYRALVLTLNKRYSDHWQLQGNWVISRDKSDDDNERDPFTVRYADLLDLGSEYSLSDRDSRHRVNVFGLYDLPHGFQVTSLVQFRSANPTTGTDLVGQDVNNDGQANDRRFVNGKDVGRNQQKKDNQFFTLDLRASKLFNLGGQQSVEAIFEVFNLTNSDNNIVSQLSGGLLFDFSGTIRSGVGDPRQAQVGLRFRF